MDVYTGCMNENAPSRFEYGNGRGVPCLCANLRRATRAVTRVYENEFRQVGFTGATQFHVLAMVARAGPVRQQDLGKLIDLDETTVVRTLKPLFQKEWLASKEGQDRREKWINLTGAGKRQLEQARPAWEKAQARIRAALPSGLWETLMGSLPKVAEAGQAA